MDPYYLAEQANQKPDSDWIILLAFLVFLINILGRLFFPNYHRRVNISFFNDYEATKLISEKRTNIPRESLLFTLNTLLILSLLTFQQLAWLNHSILPSNPILGYLKILGASAFYLIFRLSSAAAFGWLFQSRDLASRFNQTWLINFQFLGFFGIIPVFVVPFLSPPLSLTLLILLWATLLIWVIYTTIRELSVLKLAGINLFYKILYLCTLEILPVWWALSTILEEA
ncbi:MAG: DUF4271 domain-containing protein [Bacteroidales bacterium]